MESTAQRTFIEVFRVQKVQLILIALLLAFMYYPIYTLMVGEWYNDQNYSHGFIVPLISGYFLYQRLGDLKNARIQGVNAGVFVIIFGIVMLILGYVGTEYFTMRISSIVILTGIVIFLFGMEVFRIASLPLFFLVFMVPLPYIVYNAIAFPLKLFVAKYSVFFLKAVGIIVWREGNIIMFPNIELEVADACSGMRSLLSLLSLGVAFAFFTQDRNLKRLIVILSTIPVAIFANGVRVIATGILAQYWGAKAAEGFFHEFAGLAVFGLAIFLLIVTGAAVRRFIK